MASKQSTCWVIEHPEIGTAFVVADNWEQATVRAAEFWGVSWARTVSGMELVRRKAARKNICCRCGQIFHGSGDLCGACEKILRTNMVWKGREVWQKENLRVLAFDAALTEIGFGEPLAYGNMLVWDDEGGMVFILPEANLIDETLERLLEQTPLV